MTWRVLALAAGLTVTTARAAALPGEPVRPRDHLTMAVSVTPQPRDAATVLLEMRAALGGEAALDAITKFTVGGTVSQTARGFTKDLSIADVRRRGDASPGRDHVSCLAGCHGIDDLDDLPMVEHRLVPSNFRTQDGLNWPHRLTETVGTNVVSRTDLGKFRLNPKLQPKRFEIGR